MTNNKGFTLIELLIAVVILGLVVVSIGQMLDSSVRDWHRGETKLEAEQNLRLTMEKIRNEAQSAIGLDDSSTATKLILVYSGNVEIEYSLSTVEETGPGGLKGYTLQRVYRKYSDATRTSPPQTSSLKEIASYIETAEFSYHDFDDLGNMRDALAVNASFVKVVISGTLPHGDILDLKTGIALRGKFLSRE